MVRFMWRSLLAVSFAVSAFGPANAVVVMVGDPTWSATDVRANATVGITATNARSGNGSLEFKTTGDTSCVGGCQDKADFTTLFDEPLSLGSISSLSYDVYRDSASLSASHLVPSLRLLFYDSAANKFGSLVWEPIYNSATVLNDTWMTFNTIDGNFWMSLVGTGNIENYGLTLSDWANGIDSGHGGIALSADTLIYGMNTGVGSGWTNPFHGFVDNVTIAGTTAETAARGGEDFSYSANFEVAAVDIPEPSTVSIAALGLLALLASRGRKPRPAA